MWIFATYELLRTWRQFVREVEAGAGSPSSGERPKEPDRLLAEAFRRSHVEQLRDNPEFGKDLVAARGVVEPVFRRIEALRMNLAKHEVPKKRSQPAVMPGYARIDESDGSLFWFVDLGGNETDMVSRRELADDLRRAVL